MQILIQNPLKNPLTLVKGLIGYAQQDVSLHDLQTTKSCISQPTELMEAYTSNYLTHVTSEESDHKSQQKKFHIPFDFSKFTESDRDFLTLFNFEHTKLKQPQKWRKT